MNYSKIKKILYSKKVYFHSAAFIFCVLFAFCFRGYICNREVAAVKKQVGADFAPFEVESAIMYSYINAVADGKGIPEYDPRLKLTHGFRVDEQMSLGLEYFLGWGLRLRRSLVKPKIPPNTDYEKNPAETSWIINQLLLWACLVPGFVYLWLIFINCPWHIALLGGILCSIAPAAVARHTGQLILKGTFALPFLAAALAFFPLAFKRKDIISIILVMFFAFCATIFWDASQFVLGVWAIFEILRWIIYGSNERRRNVFIAVYAALIIAAVISPYNRAHYAILSPALLIAWPTLIGLHFIKHSNFKKRVLISCILFGTLTILHTAIAYDSHFAKSYSHFSSLAKAKLIHFNQKPADPEKLSFEQRFLWTPGLHSSTWKTTMNLFPYAFWAFLMLAFTGTCFRKVRGDIVEKLKYSLVPIGTTLAFFVFHVFFVRFHVFSALALNVAFAFLVYSWYQAAKKRWVKILIFILALSVVTLEGMYTLKLHRNYKYSYSKETADMIKWFRKSQTDDNIFLADMEISPLLKAYCGAKILMQPKFELIEIRKNMEKYVNLMFHGSERDFADYCVKHDVNFVVFSRGKIAPMHKFSYRYMANAKRIKTKSVAYLMEGYPRSMRYFYEIVPPKEFKKLNIRYRIFKVIPPDKRSTASYAADLAMEYYYAGKLKLARKLARAAFFTNPKSKKTYLAFYKIIGHIPKPTLKTFCKFYKQQEMEK
jgi:Q-cell neuroblast polarisation